MREDQSPAPVAGAVEAQRLAEELKALRRRRSSIACGLLTAACCDKLDAEQDALIDRLAALHPQPAPAVAVEAASEQHAACASAHRWLLAHEWRRQGDYFVKIGHCEAMGVDVVALIVGAALAARSAPAVAESQWISVEDSRPKFVGEEDTPVWTWDGHQVREDNYGLEWDQPAGPVVGGWVVTGEGFQDDTLGTVTHWMPRTPPAPPTVGSGSAQEGQANG